MERPSFYISEDAYRGLIGPGFWSIQDLPPDRAAMARPFLAGGDTLGVFASGNPPAPSAPPGEVVGGIDWARLEGRPRTNEPPINVYHYVIKAPDQHGYPVYACKEGKSIAPHWSQWPDLESYFPTDDQADGGGGAV